MDTIAPEHYIEETMAENDRISPLQKWKSMVESDETDSSGFDCNICLDTVQDPVVTLCGHLFCWPCIYKWLNHKANSAEYDELQQQCPVCKAEVSEGTLVPLFGKGQTTKPSAKGKNPNLGIIIPRRPLGLTCGFDSPRSSPFTSTPRSSHRSYSPNASPLSYAPTRSYASSPVATPHVTSSTMFDPMIGMFGDIIYARVFGNSTTNMYNYPDSYNFAGSASPRVRRHVMQADKSLSRICFFLFCCVFLCFLSF